MSADGSSTDVSVHCPSLFTWHHCVHMLGFLTAYLCQKVLQLSFIHLMSTTMCHTCVHTPAHSFFCIWISSSRSIPASGSLQKTSVMASSFGFLVVSHTLLCPVLGQPLTPLLRSFQWKGLQRVQPTSGERQFLGGTLGTSAAHQDLSHRNE